MTAQQAPSKAKKGTGGTGHVQEHGLRVGGHVGLPLAQKRRLRPGLSRGLRDKGF